MMMFFRSRKPEVPDLPVIDTDPLEEALAGADRELLAARKQAFHVQITVNSVKQTRLRNHFAPAFEAQCRPKGTE